MSGGHLLLFSVRFFKNDDAMYMMYVMYMMCMMYVYDVYDVYESNVIMWYELPYTIYHICCLSFHVLHLQNASYILYRRSPHPSVPGWEKTSCKPADAGATLFGSNFGERWRSLWVFLGCLRSKSWEIQTFFIPNFQLMKIQQAPFSKALSCVEYGDLWPVRMP